MATDHPPSPASDAAADVQTVCNTMRTLIGRVCLRDRRGTIFSPDLIDEMTDVMAEAVRLLECRPAPSSPAQAEPRAGAGMTNERLSKLEESNGEWPGNLEVHEVAELIAEVRRLRDTGLAFLEATEATLDWMNDGDLSASHKEDSPEGFERQCETLLRMKEAFRPAPPAAGSGTPAEARPDKAIELLSLVPEVK